MGTPVGPPPPPGDACSTCWGEGKPFGDVFTPKYIIAIFRDVKANERLCIPDGKPPIPSVPSEVAILLTQEDVLPCWYSNNRLGTEFGWTSFVNFFQTHIHLGRKRSDVDCDENPIIYFDELFLDTSQPPCSIHFDENDYYQGHMEGHGGSADLFW